MLNKKRIKTTNNSESRLEDTCGIAKDTEKIDFDLQENEGEKCELEAGTGNTEIPINQNGKQRTKKPEKCSKTVHLSFLPERYEPLIENDEEAERKKEEKKNRKKERNKKYRKMLRKTKWQLYWHFSNATRNRAVLRPNRYLAVFHCEVCKPYPSRTRADMARLIIRAESNLGKALRFSWKCLVAGLQNLTAGYSTPISAAVNLASGFQGTKSKAGWD